MLLLIIIWYFFIIIFGLGLGLGLEVLASFNITGMNTVLKRKRSALKLRFVNFVLNEYCIRLDWK